MGCRGEALTRGAAKGGEGGSAALGIADSAADVLAIHPDIGSQFESLFEHMEIHAMSQQYRTKPSDLMKVWSMVKSTEQRQFTIRVPADTFFKVQALEVMYPHRSRNELIADLLATALDEFEESLPSYTEQSHEVIGFDPIDNQPIFESYEVGPRADFRRLVEDARSGSPKAGELKAVETVEGAA